MIFVTLIALFIGIQARGFWTSIDGFQSANTIFTTIFVRMVIPIVMVGVSIWLFERLRLSRMAELRSDLTESIQTLERESKRLERQKQFTTMLVHEIKSPLIASHMALAGIENLLYTNNSLRQSAKNIKTALIDIDSIIDRSIEIDGYEHGEIPLTLSVFTIGQLIEFIKVNNQDERICMLIEDLPLEILIQSDLQYLKIILGNLLSNALKYSESGSPVELKLNRSLNGTQNEVVFYVSNVPGDAGVPDALRLFDRFYRADGARSKPGAGLGLWLAQSLATALSSKITFEVNGNKLLFSFPLKLK